VFFFGGICVGLGDILCSNLFNPRFYLAESVVEHAASIAFACTPRRLVVVSLIAFDVLIHVSGV
jgi:hypothetical protein